MRPSNCSWGQTFIHENFLLLGHRAWQGYTALGRGLVVCNISATDWQIPLVPYSMQFIPKGRVRHLLKSLAQDHLPTDQIVDVVHTYAPNAEIPLLLKNSHEVEIYLLQRLAISPMECFQQVQMRWSEFQCADFLSKQAILSQQPPPYFD